MMPRGGQFIAPPNPVILGGGLPVHGNPSDGGRNASQTEQGIPPHCVMPSVPPTKVRRLTRGPRDQQAGYRDLVNVLLGVAEAVEWKDPYGDHHSIQVSCYAGHLAGELRLPLRDAETIETAAALHDIGKIGVPDGVLSKPGPLTAGEVAVVRQHPLIGAAILEAADCLHHLLPLVLHHHERFDGRGYPAGLKGEAIPLGARVLQVADCIDAMLSPRSYKQGYPVERVISELKAGRGQQFDPLIAEAAVNWLEAARPAPACPTPTCVVQ